MVKAASENISVVRAEGEGTSAVRVMRGEGVDGSGGPSQLTLRGCTRFF